MRIEKEARKTRAFDELAFGDAFSYHGTILIKTHEYKTKCGETTNAMRLYDGIAICINGSDRVRKVNAVVRYSELEE